MNANYNSIISYSLHGEDLVIVFLIVIFSDVVQRIVKNKLDFVDEISILNKIKLFECSMLLISFLYSLYYLFFSYKEFVCKKYVCYKFDLNRPHYVHYFHNSF